MSIRWKNILLLMCCASLVTSSCKKQFSSDTPLPTSYTPSIIISCDNQVVYALNPLTGVKNWQLSLPPLNGLVPKDFAPSPMLYNGVLYLTTIKSDTLYKVNAETGVIIKKIAVGASAAVLPTFIATPVAAGNLIFLATTNDSLYAVDTTGVTHWVFGADAPLESSPVVYNNNVYFASTMGHVFCVATTGPTSVLMPGTTSTFNTNCPVWEYPSPEILSPATFISSAAISPPYLYIGSVADSNMYCVYLTPPTTLVNTVSPTLAVPIDTVRWIYKTTGGIYSSPEAFDGRVIFGDNDFKVYCLDSTPYLNTGLPRSIWKYTTTSQIYSSPCVTPSGLVQSVYIGSYDYNLYSINLIYGTKNWAFKSNGLIKSSPLVYGGIVYVGSYDKYLYALDSATGTLKWKFNTNGNIECSPVVNNLTGNNYNASHISGFMRKPGY